MMFVANYNDYIIILLNAEMIVLNYLSHADSEIERTKGIADGVKNYLLSEELLMQIVMIYLNFLMIKQIMQAMFNDMAFNKAEKAASMFTIDMSRKRGQSVTGATQSTWMSIVLIIVYYACDAIIIAFLTWLFGASAFVNI